MTDATRLYSVEVERKPWTTTPPTEPGDYWHRKDGKVRSMHFRAQPLFLDTGRRSGQVRALNDLGQTPEDCGGEWRPITGVGRIAKEALGDD